MKLIVGLGNPGNVYKNTRHNAGYMAVDALSALPQCEFGAWRINKKLKAELAKSQDGTLLLMKPATFMNESGAAVVAVMNFYKLPAENLCVLHDDMDVPFGAYKIQQGRGAAGHHGVESIFAHLGTRAFTRVRIGIKNDDQPREGANFVLAPFTKIELKKLPLLFTTITQDLLSHF